MRYRLFEPVATGGMAEEWDEKITDKKEGLSQFMRIIYWAAG